MTPRKKGERLTYIHQLKFNLVNTGKFSLKDVIFSIKDIYTENGASGKKRAKDYSYMGRTFSTEDVGAYQNVEIPTLNLKSKKQVYVCNLPSSFGVGDYYFGLILEWNGGVPNACPYRRTQRETQIPISILWHRWESYWFQKSGRKDETIKKSPTFGAFHLFCGIHPTLYFLFQ